MKKFFTLIAVAVMALAAQADVLTVCDGNNESTNMPISGFNYDLRNTTSQMIYPGDKLTQMCGGKITEVRFYATAGFQLGTNNIQLSFLELQQLAFDNGAKVDGAEIVAYGNTPAGETELVFTLNEPYEYTGDNLLIETVLITPGTFHTTKWYGMNPGYMASYYQYQFNWGSPFTYTEDFLPKVTFTYEPAAPAQTKTPLSATWTGVDGDHTQYVMFDASEDDCVLEYRYKYNDGEWTEWMPYDDVLAFTEDGVYEVECRAQAPGKEWSEPAYETFEITPRTAINELNGNKAVASVRYYNAAGQEMAQPNGLTIVVTTFADGSKTAAKVMK
ncbi:MAG: hypothetical protein IJK41_02950 [Muribaculaceae bacterium]|nr:hypothetical protein [Muribaculaceae bacterium]